MIYPYKTLLYICLSMLALISIISLLNAASANKSQHINRQESSLESTVKTIRINRFEVDIHSPIGEVKYNLLVLPGWNFPKEDWCNKTTLCKEALKRGFRLIMPQMGKSIYASRFYAETWPIVRSTATRQWVTDTMIKTLQAQYGILLSSQKNYIMGLSTGAHGTALIVEDLPRFFKAAALLSGDYDQTLLPQDKIFIATYGNYKNHIARWKNIDNPVTRCDSLYIPLYIGHGQADPIIPKQQSTWLYENLKKKHPHQDILLKISPSAKHDYKYWGSETTPILNFFERHQ